MPKKPARGERRTNPGLIVLSVLVIGSMTLGAVISLIDPVEEPPLPPTAAIFVTILPLTDPTLAPEATLTPTPTGPAPEAPPVAPTQ